MEVKEYELNCSLKVIDVLKVIILRRKFNILTHLIRRKEKIFKIINPSC